MANKKEVFKGKSLEDIYKEIYTNSKSAKVEIEKLTQTLSNIVINTTDAVRIIPLIKELYDTALKSDEHLIKLAQLIQRAEDKEKTSEFDLYGDLQSLLDESNSKAEPKQLQRPN